LKDEIKKKIYNKKSKTKEIAIKRMKTKFNIKIISNPMQLNEFENKIQLEKKIKKTNINKKKFNIKIKWNKIMKGDIKEKTNKKD